MSDVAVLPPYQDLTAAWRALRGRPGFSIREVACVGAPRTLLLAEYGDPALPAVHLASGVHGDEPAGPWALLAIVRDGLLDPRFRYRIWCCLNPAGYGAGTRENGEGVDINRSYGRGGTTPEARALLTANRDLTFRLAIDLHEDHEAAGFYLFEPLPPDAPSRYAGPVAAAVAAAGFPLQRAWDGFEVGPPGTEAAQRLVDGAVIVDARREVPAFAGRLPLGLVLLRRAAPAALTFESPRGRPWADRIAIHRIAVVAALAELGAR